MLPLVLRTSTTTVLGRSHEVLCIFRKGRSEVEKMGIGQWQGYPDRGSGLLTSVATATGGQREDLVKMQNNPRVLAAIQDLYHM